MRLKLLGIAGAVLLLAACDTTQQGSAASSGMGAASGAYGTGSGVDTAGLNGANRVGPGSQDDLVQNVGDRVFFGYDQFDLTAEGRSTLDRQAQWLRQYPNVTVTIEGHADERGTREYNLALAERRASSVKNYLIARGIDSNRVATISYGKERPAVLGSNEAAWAQNRRGVTMVN